MSSEISIDNAAIAAALAAAGRSESLRAAIMRALREAEKETDSPDFREQVRWPLILGLIGAGGTHRVTLDNGLVFEVGADSRIEKWLLLSSAEHPDHVWEPQTTRLLTTLAAGASNVIVGGAYIGDHVLPMARAMAGEQPPGQVHAFEPMRETFQRLLRNIELNGVDNVVPHRLGLWDTSDASLSVEGDLALASSLPVDDESGAGDVIKSVTIDDYVRTRGLERVGLIMLDTEGGEERALIGAAGLLERPLPESPNIVFEIHRHFVDWSDGLENTSIVRRLASLGYEIFALRDFHSNYPMAGKPIEIIPIDKVYLEGPPHGFNALATKDPGLVERLDLRIVENVSPKLLVDRDPALHHPVGGL